MITRRRRWVAAAAAAAAALILTGCGAPLEGAQPDATAAHDPAGTHSPAAAPTPGTAAAAAAAVAAGQVSLIQEPDAGYGPIYAGITGAHASIDMTMYELPTPPRRPT